MVLAFLALVILAGLSPAFVIIDEPITLAVVAVLAAFSLGSASVSLRSSEGSHVWSLVRPFALLAVVPAAWLLLQLIPLPFGFLANPTWDSAPAASPTPLAPRVSVDVGATMLALLRYLTACVIVLAAAATTLDRRRAEQLLLIIAIAPMVVALILCAQAFGLKLPPASDADGLLASARICLALGAVFSAASAVRAFERHETRGARDPASNLGFLRLAAFFAALCVLSWLLLYWLSPRAEFIAAALGFSAVPALIVVRRLGFGRWGLGVVATMIVVGVLAVTLSSPDIFVGRAAATDTSTAAHRMVADAAPLGSGGGTFPTLLTLYLAGPADAVGPRSSAGVMVVEMGSAFLIYSVVAALAAAIALMSGAVERGRDSFYPLAGASALIVLLATGVVAPGFSGLATLILASAGLGLAISQRITRTAS